MDRYEGLAFESHVGRTPLRSIFRAGHCAADIPDDGVRIRPAARIFLLSKFHRLGPGPAAIRGSICRADELRRRADKRGLHQGNLYHPRLHSRHRGRADAARIGDRLAAERRSTGNARLSHGVDCADDDHADRGRLVLEAIARPKSWCPESVDRRENSLAGPTRHGNLCNLVGRRVAEHGLCHAHIVGRPAVAAHRTARSRVDRRRQPVASVLARHAPQAAALYPGCTAAAYDLRVPRFRQYLCDDRRRPGQHDNGVVDVHLPGDVRAIRFQHRCRRSVADAADVDDAVCAFHPRDSSTGGALMAAVVGSSRVRNLESALIYATLTVLVLAFLFPVIWVLGLSLKTRAQVFASPPLYLWWPTFQTYADVLTRSDFVRAFINTLIVSTSAVALSLGIGAPAAYAFARFPFKGRSILFFALLVMRMLPPIAVLVPLYLLFNKIGLATTRLSVVLAYTTFSLPLVVWLMRGYFEDLPVELEESAWIDGASRFGAFMYVILPLARPGLVAASILCLQLAWNDFLFSAVLTNNATQTLPVMMAAFNAGDSGMDWGGLTASGMLVTLPVILFSFVAQRHLVAGLSSGAVKG